ncbi:MAG: glutathione S-transferase family protein [Xanthomonadales bacterium]|nr:glutathione S-transferase family protein [Xanthomonadales bacterium]
MHTVYGMSASGNCYKLQLLLAQLGQPYAWVEVDILNGESRQAEFLAKNPNGRVPLLELEDGRCLPESNAILCYLAEGSDYSPSDPWHRAQMLQWMFFEQYSHEPYIAVARFISRFLPADHPRRAELPRLLEHGHQALAVMEQHLADRIFFADSGYSLADIALFAYTQNAHEAGFDLSAYRALRSWLDRVRSQPGFVAQQA